MGNDPVFGVISLFNDPPDALTHLFDAGSSVFSNSKHPEESSHKYQNVRFMENPGHSLVNFFTYLIENFGFLPQKIALVKGNIIPRHVDSEEDLVRILSQEPPKMLWYEAEFVSDWSSQIRTKQNIYLERNTSWYLRHSKPEPEFFGSYHAFEKFLFANPSTKKWVPFSPGACYLISSKHAASIPLEVLRFLVYISSYEFFPKEAYLVERALWTILTSGLPFHSRFESDKWREDLALRKRSVALELLSSRVRALIMVTCDRIRRPSFLTQFTGP